MMDEFDKPLDQNDADDYGDDAEVPIIPHPVESSTDKDDTKKKTTSSQRYIGPALERLGHWSLIVLQWIGSVLTSPQFWNAAATVVIAITTIKYTQYAGKQWKIMEDQVRDNEAIQKARLIVDNRVCEITPAPDRTDAKFVRCVFTVRNVGGTVASEIATNSGLSRSGKLGPIAPFFDPRGPSLGAGQTHDFIYEIGDQPDIEFERSKKDLIPFYVFMILGYRDIFSGTQVLPDCMAYRPWKAPPFDWQSCR